MAALRPCIKYEFYWHVLAEQPVARGQYVARRHTVLCCQQSRGRTPKQFENLWAVYIRRRTLRYVNKSFCKNVLKSANLSCCCELHIKSFFPSIISFLSLHMMHRNTHSTAVHVQALDKILETLDSIGIKLFVLPVLKDHQWFFFLFVCLFVWPCVFLMK